MGEVTAEDTEASPEFDALELTVLIPDRFGGAIVATVGDILRYESYSEVMGNAAFDSLDSITVEGVQKLFGRVRDLNETGDSGAYWDG